MRIISSCTIICVCTPEAIRLLIQKALLRARDMGISPSYFWQWWNHFVSNEAKGKLLLRRVYRRHFAYRFLFLLYFVFVYCLVCLFYLCCCWLLAHYSEMLNIYSIVTEIFSKIYYCDCISKLYLSNVNKNRDDNYMIYWDGRSIWIC